jgi:hypothetical protein
MNPDIERLAQNVLMEADGNEATARLILASRVLALNDYAERLENRREKEGSFGFNRWPPRKQAQPLILDSVAALDVDQTQSPNG